MSDRVLLYGANGAPAKIVRDGDEGRISLLVEVFGSLLGHPSAMPRTALLGNIEAAVGGEEILKRYPNIREHIAQRRKMAEAEEGAVN